MYTKHLLKYCKQSEFEFIDIGYVKDYIFKFRNIINHKKTGVGNIEKRKKSKVYGVIFNINTNTAIQKINKKEGMKYNLYEIKTVVVNSITKNKKYKCTAYIMNEKTKGKETRPTKKYKKIVINGALENKLPSCQIKRYNYLE